jgi:predicted aspartyl protease
MFTSIRQLTDAFLFSVMLRRITSIPIEILLIEDDGAHLLIKAKINGKNAKLLIDTGASRSVFDQEKIRAFVNDKFFEKHDKLSTGLGTNSMPTSTVTIKSFKLGELLIENFNAVLLDLQHVNTTYVQLGYKAIDGVLGNDVLMRYKAVIDYKKLTLTLSLK